MNSTQIPNQSEILPGCEHVVQQASFVLINDVQLVSWCEHFADSPLAIPEWNAEIHLTDTEFVDNYVLLLDALNFCFWPDPGEPKWSISYQGKKYSGYNALAASLKRAHEQGMPILDSGFLASVTTEELEQVFQGTGMIPLLESRVSHCQEIGKELTANWDGRFKNMVTNADSSAVQLTNLIAESFPCFRDTSIYFGTRIPFYKRAQITVIDFMGTFDNKGLGHFHDADQLTAFADYKIPQVLRNLGILYYQDDLAKKVDNQTLIPAGDPREVEIRAAMIVAIDRIKTTLKILDCKVNAYELDWLFWNIGQSPLPNEQPYHKTRTIFY